MKPGYRESKAREKLERQSTEPASLARSVSGFWCFAGAAVLLCVAALPTRSQTARPDSNSFRIGVSHGSFLTVTLGDARAALRVWVDSVTRERNLKVESQVEVFEDERDMYQAFASGTVDAAAMTVEEFLASGQHPDEVYRPARASGYAEQYVVVVRRDAGIDDVRGLRGRNLVRHVHPTMGPALPWLETVLADQGLDRAETFFGNLSGLEGPSKVVLRVFFRQADACLVTSEAFEVSCELNPQLHSQLEVLATSPAVVPTIFFFRTGYTSPLRRELEAAILNLHSTPAGQQVLTVFQAMRMERLPVSALDTTRQLFERYDRLIGEKETVTRNVRLSQGDSRP